MGCSKCPRNARALFLRAFNSQAEQQLSTYPSSPASPQQEQVSETVSAGGDPRGMSIGRLLFLEALTSQSGEQKSVPSSGTPSPHQEQFFKDVFAPGISHGMPIRLFACTPTGCCCCMQWTKSIAEGDSHQTTKVPQIAPDSATTPLRR